MTIETELLMTDEFAEFSKKVANIHTEKKAKKEEFKKLYDAFQVEMAKYDVEVSKLNDEWKKFSESFSNKTSWDNKIKLYKSLFIASLTATFAPPAKPLFSFNRVTLTGKENSLILIASFELLSAIKTFVGLRVWDSRQLSRLFKES